MPTTYKGLTIPLSTDLADGPKAFQDYTDTLPVSDAFKGAEIPAGTIVFTVRTVALTGWVFLDGTTLVGAQTAYPNLWNAVPAAWRVGADIVLPDSRGRFPIAMSSDTGLDTPGELGGSRSRILVVANLPPHPHVQGGTFASGGASVRHVHGAAGGGQLVETYFGAALQLPAGNGARGGDFTGSDLQDHSHNTTISGNTGDGPGTSAPVDITPSYIAFNLMMRAS